MIVPIKPSAIELQHLEQTLATAGWALIARKMEAIGETVKDKVMKAKTWDEFLEQRGKMAGLALAFDAPHILIEEITTKLKQEGK